MTTSINTLWTVLVNNIPLGEWIDIKILCNLVEKNYTKFTIEDWKPVLSYNNEPTWKRNLISALHNKTEKSEIFYDGNASYRIDKPYIWRMIKEAVNSFEGQITYKQIKDYINNKWVGVNPLTITAQTIVLTVNHNSRTHYPENHKPRFTDSKSPYDLLYSIERGVVVKYNPINHGVWEIYKNNDDKYEQRIISKGITSKIFTPTDIIWFKNVTNTKNGTAYLDMTDNPFVIHFPTKHKANVLSPAINELILVYQKVNGIPSFTHLVTPVDDELIDDNTRPEYRYGRRVKFIAKTDINNFIPVSETIWKRLNFSGITQGNACKLKNIKDIGNIDELQFDIWQKFSGVFSVEDKESETTTREIIKELEVTNPDLSVSEGKLKLVSHLVKERNRKIITEKKIEAIKNKVLRCEVCTFSFIEQFNKEFIECHHISPIGSAGVRETTLADLSLVCANCHRMLHSKFDGQFLTIEQLKTKIKN